MRIYYLQIGDLVHPIKAIFYNLLYLRFANAFAIYILSCTGIMSIISPNILANSSAPFADAASKILGENFGYLVAACSVIACLGALNGWILMQGQILTYSPYVPGSRGQ